MAFADMLVVLASATSSDVPILASLGSPGEAVSDAAFIGIASLLSLLILAILTLLILRFAAARRIFRLCRSRNLSAPSGSARPTPSSPASIISEASARDQGTLTEAADASVPIHCTTFDEPPLERVELAFARLIEQGVLVTEAVTPEALVIARIPAHAGPVFLEVARQYRSIAFPDVGVRILLHDGEVAADTLGGWRLRVEPEELDIRLPPVGGWPEHPGGDAIVDATWSPHSSMEVARHSTILHFIVRAAVGDRI